MFARRGGRRLLAGLATAVLVCGVPPGTAAQELPRSALSVHAGGRWHEWWRSDRAPERWDRAAPRVTGAVQWQHAQPGIEWGELRLAGRGEAWRLRIILVRIDPSYVRLQLVESTRSGGTLGAWSVAAVPAEAVLGVNAGQFTGGQPWGWVVQDGREMQPPGHGPLSMAMMADRTGAIRLVPADSIELVRGMGGVQYAFQSYPVLLWNDGIVPTELRAAGRGVDVAHRDSRVAVGELRDGRMLLAITRFEGLGGVLSELPFGPTTPEMAALMGALGTRQAVMLDGGISGQLLLRLTDGRTRTWRGLRRVPLAMLLWPRA
jgi:hypothetical protein